MSSALARVAERPLPAAPAASDPIRLGEVLAASGYFQDARQAAQAAVKVMAGAELGFGPVASMTGIYIVQGRVTLGANLIAALIRKSGRYGYRITEHTDQVCEIAFTENGEQIGTSRFTMADAERAGLVKAGPWKQHPKNMLFARAVSNGARWHCPDIFAGPVYTPDEMGAAVNGEGEFIAEAAPAPAPVRDEPPTDEQAQALAGALGELRRLEPGTDHVARIDEWFRAKYPDADPQRPTRAQTQALIEAMLQKAAVLMAAGPEDLS